ncbi:21149_t:CDS:1, partial [Entrophospora sp. SA101]
MAEILYSEYGNYQHFVRIIIRIIITVNVNIVKEGSKDYNSSQ